MTVEIEVEKTLEEASVMIEADKEKKAYHQVEMVIGDMTVQM